MDGLSDIIQLLNQIEEDNSVPKNVRIRVCSMKTMFEKETMDVQIKIDRSLQELDEISDDPNIPSFIRTQIWSIVSLLESKK